MAGEDWASVFPWRAAQSAHGLLFEVQRSRRRSGKQSRSCSTYEERIAAHYSRLGAPPGSAEYWPCIQEAEELQQRNAEMWGGVAATGASMLAPPPNVYVMPRY
jgi:hypothetical protein